MPVILILVVCALVLLLLAARLSRATGLPAGQLVYSDTGQWGRVEQPLFSARLGLTGKPDYLVRVQAEIVPVEVKSGRAPTDGPYAAHVYQLAAYCALVAEAYARRPSHGLIQYADRLFRVDYTPALEEELLGLLADMQTDADAQEVDRSHSSAARCRACGLRDHCEQRLGA